MLPGWRLSRLRASSAENGMRMALKCCATKSRSSHRFLHLVVRFGRQQRGWCAQEGRPSPWKQIGRHRLVRTHHRPCSAKSAVSKPNLPQQACVRAARHCKCPSQLSELLLQMAAASDGSDCSGQQHHRMQVARAPPAHHSPVDALQHNLIPRAIPERPVPAEQL
jgi:hypothetical protein